MIRMPAALAAAKLSVRMLFQVHDELIFEVRESELEATAEIVKRTMEAAASLSVPLVCETGHGPNRDEAH